MIDQEKKELRNHFTDVRASMSLSERRKIGHTILENLFEMPAFKNASLVCSYISIRNEIDLWPLEEATHEHGKTLALPRTFGSVTKGKMEFYKVDFPSKDFLIPGEFGTSVPGSSCEMLDLSDFQDALIIVPGLSFDLNGYRLGYGGGFYDTFLNKLNSNHIAHTSIGLVYDACIAEALPHEAWDCPVQTVMSERRLLHID